MPKDILKEIAEQWFPDHVAKFTEFPDGVKILEWRNKNGSNVYWFTAIMHKGMLLIYGDIGEAVYRWNSPINWSFLEDMGIDYFESKCQASETGRRYYEWDKQKVISRMEEHLRDFAEDEEKGTVLQELLTIFDDEGGIEAAESEQTWLAWFDDHYRDTLLFGPDDTEWAPGCGRTVHRRCIAHLKGIQMALKKKS